MELYSIDVVSSSFRKYHPYNLASCCASSPGVTPYPAPPDAGASGPKWLSQGSQTLCISNALLRSTSNLCYIHILPKLILRISSSSSFVAIFEVGETNFNVARNHRKPSIFEHVFLGETGRWCHCALAALATQFVIIIM